MSSRLDLEVSRSLNAIPISPSLRSSDGMPVRSAWASKLAAKGWRVEATDELAPTLEAAFAAGGVHLVDVPIDYSENTRVLIEELRGTVPEVEPA